MQNLESLVRAAQRGDADAFAQIYQRFFDRVYKYLLVRVGNAHEAEDLTQEVFVRVLEALPSFRWRGLPFAAWVFRITHNLVVDRHRRRSVAGDPLPLEAALPIPSGHDVEHQAALTLDGERLQRALDGLTPAQKQVVLLRFIAGLSVGETARVVGRSENAVKALQHSALRALRRFLSPGYEGAMSTGQAGSER